MKSNIMTLEGFKKWFSTQAPRMTPDALRSYLNSLRSYNFKTVTGAELYADEIELCKKLLNLENGTN